MGVRPCKYDDFCILLRGRKGFAAYEGALRTAGIPVFADSATDLLGRTAHPPLRGAAARYRQPCTGYPAGGGAAQPFVPLHGE